MTDIKRLSLHGRLRMASVVRGPDTDLMIEAADAIEQHEAFKRELVGALEGALAALSDSDDEGLIEHADSMIRWRTALVRAKEASHDAD